MALNSSGPISIGGSTSGQSIALELSLSATGQISLNDTAVRGLAGISSGAISLNSFYGKSSLTTKHYFQGGNTPNTFTTTVTKFETTNQTSSNAGFNMVSGRNFGCSGCGSTKAVSLFGNEIDGGGGPSDSKVNEISGVNFTTQTLYNPATTSSDSHGFAGMAEKDVRALAGKGQTYWYDPSTGWNDDYLEEIVQFSFSTEVLSSVTNLSRPQHSSWTQGTYGEAPLIGYKAFVTSTYAMYGGPILLSNVIWQNMWFDKFTYSTNTVTVVSNNSATNSSDNDAGYPENGCNGSTLGYFLKGNAGSGITAYTVDLSNAVLTVRTSAVGTTSARCVTDTPTGVYRAGGWYWASPSVYGYVNSIDNYSLVTFTATSTSATTHNGIGPTAAWPNFT